MREGPSGISCMAVCIEGSFLFALEDFVRRELDLGGAEGGPVACEAEDEAPEDEDASLAAY